MSPDVPGLYSVDFCFMGYHDTSGTPPVAFVYRNGSLVPQASASRFHAYLGEGVISIRETCLVECNGSTDYIEAYCHCPATAGGGGHSFAPQTHGGISFNPTLTIVRLK